MLFKPRQTFLLSAFALFALALVGCGSSTDEAATQPTMIDPDISPRIVALDGDLTELVFALGMGDHVVGADQSSQYPEEILQRPRLNYHRQTSAESVLALEPDIVIYSHETGPPTSIEQIQNAGIETIKVEFEEKLEDVVPKIQAVAEALDRVEEGEALIAQFEADLEQVKSEIALFDTEPSVLFLYAREGMGPPVVMGKDSGANVMIELAGGRNAAGDMDQAFVSLNPEALLDLEPDCILMLDKGFEALGGLPGLMSLPGMKETPAGQNENIVTLPDDLLFSFGPRTPEAVRMLAKALHPEISAEGQ